MGVEELMCRSVCQFTYIGQQRYSEQALQAAEQPCPSDYLLCTITGKVLGKRRRINIQLKNNATQDEKIGHQ